MAREITLFSVLLVVIAAATIVVSDDCSQPVTDKQSCGSQNITWLDCEKLGCCWNIEPDGGPQCYYKSPRQVNYLVSNVETTPLGVKITVKADSQDTTRGSYGKLISPLVIEVSAQTAQRLHVKIYDPNDKRWEVPDSFSPKPDDPSLPPSSPLYTWGHPSPSNIFTLSVIRSDTWETILDFYNLQFFDQFQTITTPFVEIIPFINNLYGLGEHMTPSFRLEYETYTLWNTPELSPFQNLYGSHPFYLNHRAGKSYGVYLRNSNGMDVIYADDGLTFNTIGGILDFYIFLGPEPEAVVQQYQEVIGRPQMPPYWALGFHQCRDGYHNINVLKEVVANYSSAKIPLDAIWTDIDYMDQFRDFTLNPRNFPADEMKSFVDDLHANGQHYVMITEPGIATLKGYKPYDDGVSMDIFLKQANSSALCKCGVWPGISAFPDYFNPMANKYWYTQISDFHEVVPFDGLWLDMNEISCIWSDEKSKRQLTFDPNHPPYTINNRGKKAPLSERTLRMDCQHYGGALEYNAHNLYGLAESMATSQALRSIRQKRSLVISRSTFPGSGQHAGHWTGIIHANFNDLQQTIPSLLSFQLYSIPLVGADICGFTGDTTKELCSRWVELGAFYPFMRSHNNKNAIPQELYRWDSVAAISRKMLGIRYSLLPYYYTLFYKAYRPPIESSPSATILRPLFFEFPEEIATYNINQQFMVGSKILISPVLEQGVSSIGAYIPDTMWYDFYSKKLFRERGGTTVVLDTPIDHIQIHIRGGSVIPMQLPALTTTETRKNDYELLVALDSNGQADGDFYMDDGESLDMRDYTFMEYICNDNSLHGKATGPGYSGDTPPLMTVTILGMKTRPTTVLVNGSAHASFTYNEKIQSLTVTEVNISMIKDFILSWE